MAKKAKKKRIQKRAPVDEDDLLSHILEDVYVNEACAEHGRTVRVVAHADTDTLELVGCNEAAVKRVKDRMTSGNFTVRGSVLRRPDDDEFARLLQRYRLDSLDRMLGTDKAPRRLSKKRKA